MKNAVLIAGPTASGKSALALEVARRTGGIVVNADSMQVYSGLAVLTARPPRDVTDTTPHRLYGHVDPADPYSTGRWLGDVEALIAEGTFDRVPAIFVGGTGLYFRALTEGLAPMPAVPDEIRTRWRDALGEQGPGALHDALARKDPEAAQAIRPADGQRIVRALEVFEATGRSIRAWQGDTAPALVASEHARKVVVEPERPELRRRIEERFDRMVEAGALAEVEALLKRGLAPSMPAMKAIGVRELGAFLSGETTLAAAVEKAKTATRRYAKRQTTWFRHQLGPGWRRLACADAVDDETRLW